VRRAPGKKTLEPAQAVDPNAAHAAAVTLLARRDFSTSDIERRLTARGFTREAIAQALTELKSTNALNDARFGQNLVAQRTRRGRGPMRIRNELRTAGVISLFDARNRGSSRRNKRFLSFGE
jgi:regulatory protein